MNCENAENTSDLLCFFECIQDNDLHTLDRMFLEEYMSLLDRILWAQITARIKTFLFSFAFIAVLAGWCLIHFDRDYYPVQMSKPKIYVDIGGMEWKNGEFGRFEGKCTNIEIKGNDYIFTFEDGKKVYADKFTIYKPSLDKIKKFNKEYEEYYK